jgi:hypothetical protein
MVHVSMTTHNATKVFVGFKEVSLKAIQSMVWKIITRTKKYDKGHSEWHRACLDVGFSH